MATRYISDLGRNNGYYSFGGGKNDIVISDTSDINNIYGYRYYIIAGGGDDRVVGNNGNDKIYGGKGNDALFGGNGADTLLGELGNDTVYGDGGDDYVAGGDGNDSLYGGSGDDRLYGGSGNDTLTGGDGSDNIYLDQYVNSGNDVVVFDSLVGSDSVFGYSSVFNKIHLSKSVFTALSGSVGETLSASQFNDGGISTADQRIFYDASRGNLYYDEDGPGPASSILIATIFTAPALSASDFIIA